MAMNLTEATKKYDELINGGYLTIRDLCEMSIAFRKAARRTEKAARKSVMYERHRNCERLTDYCINNWQPFAKLADVERR